jgi:D-alanyl-D-alanine carboxypeptidase
MARLLQDLLRPTSVLLGPEGRRLLTAPQTTSAGRPTGTTLGWHLAPGDRGFLFKEGGGAGFHCEMRLYPTRGLGTIAMGNSGAFDVKRLLARLDGELVG